MDEDRGTGRVFISYRRQETAWPARQLYQLLVAELGADRVFKDVDNIEPGDDFVTTLQSAVSSCDVLLALIGPQWLSITGDHGRRRLDDPSDFVRIEVETALARDDVRVIPILVDDATMPKPEQLPAGLDALTRRQAIEISPVTLDTRRLLKVVRDTLALAQSQRQSANPSHRPMPTSQRAVLGSSAPRRRVLLSGLAVLLALVTAGGLAYLGGRDVPGTGAKSATDQPSVLGSHSAVATAVPPASATSATPAGATGSDVLAHRGGDEDYPLETFESLTNAADEGFAVETDVRWTRDGRAIIVHDEAATKGVRCDGPYQVSKSTWQQLNEHCRSFSLNKKSYPLTTYETLMEGLAAYRSWVYVEVKVDQTPAQNREFVDRIRSNGLSDRTVVTSTDPDRLAQIAELAPDLRRLQFVNSRVSADRLAGSELWGAAVRFDVATEDYVAELRRAGLVVVVWTVNEERTWAEALAVGADKVLTDKPNAYLAWRSGQ